MKIHPLLILLATVVASGCASVYHPVKSDSKDGGYSENRLEPDRWTVTYALPAYEGERRDDSYAPDGKSYLKMRDLAKCRAAELCVGEGYAWFTIQNETDATKTSTQRAALDDAGAFERVSRVAAASRSSGMPRTPSQTSRPPSSNKATTVRLTEPKIVLTIRAFHEKPNELAAFEAAPLLQKLREQYR